LRRRTTTTVVSCQLAFPAEAITDNHLRSLCGSIIFLFGASNRDDAQDK